MLLIKYFLSPEVFNKFTNEFPYHLRRCCLLEAGPVRTLASARSAAVLHEKVDLSTVDPKTQSLLELVMTNIGKEFGKHEQTSQEIAHFVKEIIVGEKCNLRFQTNDEFGSLEVASKLADPTGNTSVEIITKRYCCEHS